jgi:D-alanine-D-alanine ligase
MSISPDMRVAVLYGGFSDERTVSLTSGEQVNKALVGEGIKADLIDTQDGREALGKLIAGDYDVAFIALHGKGGEDGTIQGALETLKIPYTGSGVAASAVAMDKARSKASYGLAGLDIAKSVTLAHPGDMSAEQIVAAVGQKCVVKPCGDGSSVGMSIVHEAAELPHALEVAFACGQTVMVESYVTGTEVTVAVLGNDDPQPLPVIEIVPHAEFYDFEVKYSANGAEHIIPARLDPQVYERVQQASVRAHKALGCRGVSRSDFIITADGTPVILETNTIPGMTPTSLLPDAASKAGMSFAQVCVRLLELALEK